MSISINLYAPNVPGAQGRRTNDPHVTGALAAIVGQAVRQASDIYGLGNAPVERWNALVGDGNPASSRLKMNAPIAKDIVRSITTTLGMALNIAPMSERDLYDALDRFAQKVAVLVNATPYRLDDVFAAFAGELADPALATNNPEAMIAALQELSDRLPERL